MHDICLIILIKHFYLNITFIWFIFLLQFHGYKCFLSRIPHYILFSISLFHKKPSFFPSCYSTYRSHFYWDTLCFSSVPCISIGRGIHYLRDNDVPVATSLRFSLPPTFSCLWLLFEDASFWVPLLFIIEIGRLILFWSCVFQLCCCVHVMSYPEDNVIYHFFSSFCYYIPLPALKGMVVWIKVIP